MLFVGSSIGGFGRKRIDCVAVCMYARWGGVPEVTFRRLVGSHAHGSPRSATLLSATCGNENHMAALGDPCAKTACGIQAALDEKVCPR